MSSENRTTSDFLEQLDREIADNTLPPISGAPTIGEHQHSDPEMAQLQQEARELGEELNQLLGSDLDPPLTDSPTEPTPHALMRNGIIMFLRGLQQFGNMMDPITQVHSEHRERFEQLMEPSIDHADELTTLSEQMCELTAAVATTLEAIEPQYADSLSDEL